MELFIGLGSWYEQLNMENVVGLIIIQMIEIVLYFIGEYISKEKSSFYIGWFNVTGSIFMPISMLASYIILSVFG